VGFSVKLGIHGRKSYNGSLSSLNHGEPKDSSPDENVCHSRVCICREIGLRCSDQTHDNDDREDEKAHGVGPLDDVFSAAEIHD